MAEISLYAVLLSFGQGANWHRENIRHGKIDLQDDGLCTRSSIVVLAKQGADEKMADPERVAPVAKHSRRKWSDASDNHSL
jgi:hypothetical protein